MCLYVYGDARFVVDRSVFCMCMVMYVLWFDGSVSVCIMGDARFVVDRSVSVCVW